MVDAAEQPLAAAQRELAEETGFASQDWTLLGVVEPNPALQDNLCHIFLAKDCRPIDNPQHGQDTTEDIQVKLIPEDQVMAMARSGEIRHAIVLAALFHYFSYPRDQKASAKEKP